MVNNLGIEAAVFAKLLVETLVIWALFTIYVWAFTKPRGPVDAAFWYPQALQDRFCELGLTTKERIARRRSASGVIGILASAAIFFVFIVLVNGERTYLDIFWQTYLLFELMEVWDLLFVDTWWVALSGWWDIPGTEGLQHLYKDWPTKLRAKGTRLLIGGLPAAAVLAAIFWATAHLV